MIHDAFNQFRDAIAATGLTPPDHVEADGNLHRFSSSGKPRDDSGWYVLHNDEMAAGAFGCWRTGLQSSWSSKNTAEMTQAERNDYRLRNQAMQQQRDADIEKRQDLARESVAALWQQSDPAHDHPYLTHKKVQGYGLKVFGEKLLIPLRDTTGTMHSLQTIDELGEKRFHSGGRVKGCYHAIGKPSHVIVICEGYATGASIHEATGHAVAVAFNAGNLQPVAEALRAKLTNIDIVIAGDDDHQTDGNPGRSKAAAAALAVGAVMVLPTFSADRPIKATDFNDLCVLSGPEAVRQCIDGVLSAPNVATVAAADNSQRYQGWPEPQPLCELIQAEPYPLDALPDLVRLAVEEVHGFVKAPVPLIVASALAAMSLGIQAHADVERAARLSGPTGLFMMAIADSGERKTTCDSFFTRGVRAYEAQAQEAAKALIQSYKSEHEAWEAQRAGLKDKIKELAKRGSPRADQIAELEALNLAEPVAPRVPRMIYSDITPEELAFKLANHWPSGGVISSEAGTVLGGHGMGKDSAMRNMALLNQLWDGGEVHVDRRSSASFTVRGARFTMALQVQETTLRAFFDSSKGLARGTGFLARFLISYPESTQGTRHFTEAPSHWPHLQAFDDRLTQMLQRPAPLDEHGGLHPILLTLTPEAKQVWVQFHDVIEAELGAGRELQDVRDVASKTADNAARIAALFHEFSGAVGSIGAETMEAASRVAAWHLNEVRRVLSEIVQPAEDTLPARLEAWMLAYCKREGTNTVPTRDVARYGPAELRDKDTFTKAVTELTELSRARLISQGRKKFVLINPILLAAGGV